jgi:hypothetical protein
MTEQTENTANQTAAKPMFFNRMMTLDRALHADLKFDPAAGYAFAAETSLIPIAVNEFRFVARHYPIVFGTGPLPMPLAVVGLQPGSNLFVEPGGTWRAGSYIPACVQTYPFVFLPTLANGKDISLVIDPEAKSLGEKGDALFADGQPAPTLDRIIRLAGSFRDGMRQTLEFARMLAEYGLVAPHGIDLVLQNGTKHRIEGVLTIDPRKIDEAANNIFLRWRKAGWLTPIYQSFQSIDAWTDLAELDQARNSKA